MFLHINPHLHTISRVTTDNQRVAPCGGVIIRKLALLIGLFLTGFLSLPSIATSEEFAKMDSLAALQGGWKVTGLEVDGKPGELPGVAYWLVVKGDKLYYGGQELAKLTGDTTTTPPCLNLTFHKPDRMYEAVYNVEGDTLKLCINRLTEGVKERPTSFDTQGKPEWRLLILKRDKERKADDLEGLSGFVGVAIMASKDSKEILIANVLEGSPAQKAGLKKDDVLLKIGGQDATDLMGTVKMIRNAKPGSDLVLRVRRGDKEQDLTVKVGVAPFFLLD